MLLVIVDFKGDDMNIPWIFRTSPSRRVPRGCWGTVSASKKIKKNYFNARLGSGFDLLLRLKDLGKIVDEAGESGGVECGDNVGCYKTQLDDE